MKLTESQWVTAVCLTAVAMGAVLLAVPKTDRYTVRCYEPSLPDSQLIAEWSGLHYADCDRTACTMGTRHHKTVYVIPQGIACAVENEP